MIVMTGGGVRTSDMGRVFRCQGSRSRWRNHCLRTEHPPFAAAAGLATLLFSAWFVSRWPPQNS